MPQTKSAAKALRQTLKKTQNNKKIKDHISYLSRQLKKTLLTNDQTKIEDLVRKLVKAYDKAAQKKVIKKNTAARKKSRMMKKINTKRSSKN